MNESTRPAPPHEGLPEMLFAQVVAQAAVLQLLVNANPFVKANVLELANNAEERLMAYPLTDDQIALAKKVLFRIAGHQP